MGIDYSASFGIGVEIGVEIDNIEDNMYDYLERLLNNTSYVYAQYGNSFTGENTFMILIKDPFENGYDITKKINELKKFLDKNNIKYDKIDLVGGSYVF